MTEHEFDQQIWRNYDRVTIQLSPDQAPWKQKVNSVCFPTHSVQVNMPNGGRDWVRCDYIVSHSCALGVTEDVEMIEDLHNKLMESQEKLRVLEFDNKALKDQLSKNHMADIRKALLVIQDKIDVKKRNQEFVDKALERLNYALDKMTNNN